MSTLNKENKQCHNCKKHKYNVHFREEVGKEWCVKCFRNDYLISRREAMEESFLEAEQWYHLGLM